jgi:transcriptional regulator with GAF, ATPase, and Fis domain
MAQRDSIRSLIKGRSPSLAGALQKIRRAAPTNVPILIMGETGTGKELAARLVHEESRRSEGPFVAVNCAAIPKDLLESELFGHERGAFTGALSTKAGAFERAHGGTLFLDEIGDMALEHQAKVLRAIQEGEVQRVGGSSPKKIDVRIVAATHRDLRARAVEGAFREDLYYRLAGYELRLPPLRERGRDVLAIAKALLERESPGKYFSRSAQALLLGYSWPGNVREVENVVRAAAIDARGRRISERVVRRHPAFAQATRVECPRSTKDQLVAMRAFIETHGRIGASDVRDLFNVKKTRAYSLLEAWERTGAIEARGDGRGTYYVTAGGAAPRPEPAPETGRQLPARQQLAVRLATERGRLSRQEYEKEAGVSARTAKRDLAELVERGKLTLDGAGRNAAYRPAS